MICNNCKRSNQVAQSVTAPWRIDIQEGSKLLNMRTSVDSDQPFDTVSQSDDETAQEEGDMIDDQELFDEQVALNISRSQHRSSDDWIASNLTSQSANLKDSLLRSSLCRQPAGEDAADALIVEGVMTAAQDEALKAASYAAAMADNISPITVTTDSSSDLN